MRFNREVGRTRVKNNIPPPNKNKENSPLTSYAAVIINKVKSLLDILSCR